ncbi:helix-turn-helix domain-containing protein [Rhodococcus sp. T2V]|uniref:helix-turn-helix domain-containing protein n=1 Tax=Rhodococcus sp. T2V TaxID=3034164 RepID=UPI0023E14E62|nr:helix-turn-helix domain-containing protein [Rhodococcus sp. T2V]MDF3313459.1 helix-turn-helix domain-containing protein [Rhodococcus sp. T2V]
MPPTSNVRSTKKKFHLITPEVTRLHSEGLSQAAIARTLQVSASTVARAAEAAGLTFDRTRTAPATAASQVDAKTRRETLVNQLHEGNAAALTKIGESLAAGEFGPRDLVTLLGVGIDKLTKLSPPVDPHAEGIQAAHGLLDQFVVAIDTYQEIRAAENVG